MPVTQTDIAKEANVSSATVSRVLNNANDPFISQKTRERVLEAARKMGYRPNYAARALATGRTNVISLWMPGMTSPYATQVISGVQKEVRRHGYEIIASDFGDQTGWLTGEMGSCGWPVDGILAHNGGKWLGTVMEENPASDKPFVSMGSSPSDLGDVVKIDLKPATREVVHHLFDGGCQRVAHMLAKSANSAGEQRRETYMAVMEEAGRLPEFITSDGTTRNAAREALRDYVGLHGCPGGIFCANDDLAIGAYRGLRDLGLRIPDDVALVGCNGVEDTEYFDPPISTIAQPVIEMCKIAWEFLRQRMANGEGEAQKVTLTAELIVRESSRRYCP